jgi:4'-phosphopantetheinyl transferase
VNVYWFEQCAADMPADDEWLSDAERIRSAALRVPKRRADWRLGRLTAKRAVAAYLRRNTRLNDLAQIELKLAPSGAPVAFTGNTRAPCSLSLSHRAGRALCAIADPTLQIGCDLEVIEPRSDAFISDYFTGTEQDMIAGTPLAQRDAIATLLWSLKETALKALEVGLRADTRSVEVSLPAPYLIEHQTEGQWRPATVCCSSGDVFWCGWKRSGDLIYTLASSHCFRPVELQFEPTAIQPSRPVAHSRPHIHIGSEV